MDFLADNIKLWLTYSEKINLINKNNKILKEKKNNIENNIIKFLKQNNLNQKIININNFKINVNQTYTPAPLSIKILEESLDNCVDNYTKTQILENIKHLRNLNKKQCISLKKKLIRNKSSKKKFT
tara:strand:+ start:83 stop:460 length:378 start_codon:yes stop_codon:yes gene_type:complete